MSRIEELEKRLAADPNSRMFVQLAEEYRKAGMLEQAIDVCEQGLKKHPQYPSARVALGRALLEAEEFDRASAEFESVLKQVPDNILANKFLGETYHRLGRHDDALKKYKVAHTLAPEDTELDERIAEVRAAIAGGGAPPPQASEPSPAPAPPQATAAPPPPSPPPAVVEPEPEPPARNASEDLAPIPLVDVDEPMILEGRNYVPPPRNESSASAKSSHAVLEPTLVDPPRPPRAPVAPPAVKPPAAQPSAPTAAPAAEIETPTMAEIYASQGHFDRAIAVYQRILERLPNDAGLQARLEELQMLSSAVAAPPPSVPPSSSVRSRPSGEAAEERTIQVLEQWLEAIQRSRGA